MIIRLKDIYRELATEDLSEQVIESIGVSIFAQLRHELNNPEELAIELPKLGTFALKQKKFFDYFNYVQSRIRKGHFTPGVDYPEHLYESYKKTYSKLMKFRETKMEKRVIKDEAKTNKSRQSGS